MDKIINKYLNEEKQKPISKKDAKEIAQDELLDSAGAAFYKLGDGHLTRQDGEPLTKEDKKLVDEALHKQVQRIAKMFGINGYRPT